MCTVFLIISTIATTRYKDLLLWDAEGRYNERRLYNNHGTKKFCSCGLLPNYRSLMRPFSAKRYPTPGLGFWARGYQVRDPIPLKIRRVWGLLHLKSYVGGQTFSRWCGAEVCTGGTKPGVVLVM
ncbi:hypothetical protein AVEN_246307-1 [Araneus ventricosus]|uniref:Uncharacterized protein n=1 Tax=Araneus ventricosus TaxID=182803 RepID=A0A4Y2W496_ARAVE|nr:hypothetical protein AVEN_246307-1 [Araneus ventricosus]